MVDGTLGLHRARLTLILADLPNAIGAYHISGSNLIVLNRVVLNAMKTITKSSEELNAFVFSILMHEYLHSLGYGEEVLVRSLVKRVSEENLGRDHPSVRMANGNLFRLYPQLRGMGEGKLGQEFEVIKDFDKSSMPYIG